MNETTASIGSFLRRERERRGIALKTISEETKVSVSLLEGLEADDLSRWPNGIFRRAFVRGYATSIGLDPDDIVRRFEQQHQPPVEESADAVPAEQPATPEQAAVTPAVVSRGPVRSPRRTRLLATAADLTVAVVLGLGSAAAGSRMLWPVLLIAAYYALGSALTGTTPMVALLGDESAADLAQTAAVPVPAKPPLRKGRQENTGREARHESSPRRRHGRVVNGPRGVRS
jgi:transcriptional regulator with XRE-family HTH domain